MGPDQEQPNKDVMGNDKMPVNDEGVNLDDDKMSPMEDMLSKPPVMMEAKPKRKKMWIWLIIIAIAILVAAAAGWWWWDSSRKDGTKTEPSTSTTTEPSTTETTTACAEGLTEYENTDLGIGFCYPTGWGDVTVTDAKFESADVGQRWRASFADKAAVNLGLVTDDWSTVVPRDGTCVDPAVKTLPAFSPFSTAWITEGTPVSNASRGIEVSADAFLINEEVDNLLTNGVCIRGYTVIAGDVYQHTTASYSADFNSTIASPQDHVDNPNTLISEADRADFYDFVKSIHTL